MQPFQTNYDREVQKWNKPKREGGMRPDHFEEFPVMLYRARRGPNGGPFKVIDPSDESWSMANCQTARNEEERQRLLKMGLRGTPQEAIAEANREEDEIAMQAAHRNHDDRNMSDLAKREIAAAADEAGMAHLAEVPESPKRRGWPKGKSRKATTEPAA